MSNGILFDNFIIADSKRVVDQWAADSWALKHAEENYSSVGDQLISVHTHTHTRLTALFDGTTRVSRYQKGKTNLDFTDAKRQ